MTDPILAHARDVNLTRQWGDRALARRALFEARDAMTATILAGAGIAALADIPLTIPVGSKPTFVLTLRKPVRPRSWWARRGFAAERRKRRTALEQSGLFDPAWYRTRYADVAQSDMDGLTHFLDHGSFEGRSPGPRFDAIAYLARYPDVVDAGIEPWLHYLRHGHAEGRNPV